MGQEYMDVQNWSLKTFTNLIGYVESAFKKKQSEKPPAQKHHTDLLSICGLLLVQLKATLLALSTSKSDLNLPFRKLILKSEKVL